MCLLDIIQLVLFKVVKVTCRVPMWKKYFVKIVTRVFTVLLKMTSVYVFTLYEYIKKTF